MMPFPGGGGSARSARRRSASKKQWYQKNATVQSYRSCLDSDHSQIEHSNLKHVENLAQTIFF
jgi:hypothetical protein